jgi:hypothetical protein
MIGLTARLALYLIAIAIATASAGQAPSTPDPCGDGSPSDAASGLEEALTNAKSCKAAAEIYEQCRWGSSADVGFAGIVNRKCQQEYRGKLTPAQQKNLNAQIELCNYEYAQQEGTLAISENVSCHVEVAVAFATDPQKAAVPIRFASFDCRRAKNRLDRAICSDAALGRADLVLSRVYSADLKFANDTDRTALIGAEKKWLASLPAKCRLTVAPSSRETLACLRNEFEMRFSFLDQCTVGGVEECLKGN